MYAQCIKQFDNIAVFNYHHLNLQSQEMKCFPLITFALITLPITLRSLLSIGLHHGVLTWLNKDLKKWALWWIDCRIQVNVVCVVVLVGYRVDIWDNDIDCNAVYYYQIWPLHHLCWGQETIHRQIETHCRSHQQQSNVAQWSIQKVSGLERNDNTTSHNLW